MHQDVKKKVLRRLKIIEGQVRGLQKMVEKETYCVDVITQSSAVRHALSSLEDVMLEHHLSLHTIEQMKRGAHQKAVKEIMDIYRLSKEK